MAQNYDIILTYLILFRQKISTLCRLNPKRCKEIGSYSSPAQPFWIAASYQVIQGAPMSGEILKHSSLLLPVEEVPWRYRELWKLWQLGLSNRHDSIRFLIGKRFKKNRINNTEDRSVGSNTKCQRYYSNNSKAGVFQHY